MAQDLTKVRFEIVVCMLAEDAKLRRLIKNLLKVY